MLLRVRYWKILWKLANKLFYWPKRLMKYHLFAPLEECKLSMTMINSLIRGEHKGIRWVTSILGVKLEKDDIDLIKTFLDLGRQIGHVKNLSLMNFALSDKMLNATRYETIIK